MRDVRLGVSWIDGQAFSQWWEPLPDASEFHLLSCYVSEEGWSVLERILDARPEMQATLVFSLSGIERGRAEHAALALFELIQRQTREGRVRGFLIADSGRLFHPKAHSSRSIRRTRVVVGSANLTGGGLFNNHEMVGVIENDVHAYTQFLDAVNELRHKTHAIAVNNMTRAEVLRWLQSRPIRSAPSGSEGSRREEPRQLELRIDPHAADPLPPAVTEPLTSTSAEGGDLALTAVERLLRLGGRLYYFNTLEDLTVPVSLDKFKRADIIASTAPSSITDGLSMQHHSTMAVKLIPDDLSKQLRELNTLLGQLKGRFSLETAGLPWLPADWEASFLEHWKVILQTRGPQPGEVRARVRSHLTRLKRELQEGNAPLLGRLREAVRLRPVESWHREAAERLLGSRLNERRALDAIVEHACTTVEKHVQEEFVLSQLANIHQIPRFRSCRHEQVDALDALHVLADWTLACIRPHVRVDAIDAHSPRSGVAQILLGRLDERSHDPIGIYKLALAWRRNVSEPREDVITTLANAWTHFSTWFMFREDSLESWLGGPPSFSASSAE